MTRLIFFLAITFLVACAQNETKTTDASTTNEPEVTRTPNPNPLGSSNLDIAALAQSSCDCIKTLMEERAQIAKLREEGNKAEALKLITSSKKTQREAFECSKEHFEKIKYNKGKWPNFEKSLLTKCPQGGNALLIMHDIHYKE